MPFQKLTPNLMVADVVQTVTFYRDHLGFQLVMAVPLASEAVVTQLDGRPMQYALVQRDGVELMFQQRESLRRELPQLPSTIGASLTLYCEVTDLATWAAQLPASLLVKPLATTFYGMRELYLRDLNGYILCLAEPVSATG